MAGTPGPEIESAWFAASEPQAMLALLPVAASKRKLRLLGCAACRRIWDLMLDPRCRAAVEASEQFADGLISEEQLDLISAGAEEAYEEIVSDDTEDAYEAASVPHTASYASSPSLSWEVFLEVLGAAAEAAPRIATIERSAQADMVRCIFGNPFRPVTLDPAWRTSTVLALAEGIYADRAFNRLPILADALQDAGCENADVLDHCRGPGPHARGCWVIDLILGKT